MIHSRAVPTKMDKSTGYRLAIKYTYSVDGKPTQGNGITASDGDQKTRTKAQMILKEIPVSGEVDLYYSPSDPGHSV